ncbi:MAG: DUF3014 domain-containing protein [Pseudomonadales bacterium]|nr:DUF3014 domain-containing protein [Pseudomonadales bacterium]
MRNPVLIFGLIFITATAAFLLFKRQQTVPLVEAVAINMIPADEERDQPVVALINREPIITAVQAEVAAVQAETKSELEVELTVARAQALDGSDVAVKSLMTSLNPSLLQWFDQDELLRKFVMAVDRLASGELPTQHLPLQYAKASFTVQQINTDETLAIKKTFIAGQNNTSRFDALISALNIIPPASLAAYYQDWSPLLEEAYLEMGMETTFDQRLHQAITQLLLVKALPEDSLLIQPHVFYEYQDPNLEQANGLNKFLWRVGKDNRLRLQTYLRELKSQL